MKKPETLASTKLSRGEFLKLSGAGLAGTTLLGILGCGRSASSGGKGLVFASSGCAYQSAQSKASLEPHSKETGTEIRQYSPTDYTKIQAMVEDNRVI